MPEPTRPLPEPPPMPNETTTRGKPLGKGTAVVDISRDDLNFMPRGELARLFVEAQVGVEADVLVLKVSKGLSAAQQTALRWAMEREFPSKACVVLEEGMELEELKGRRLAFRFHRFIR